MEPKPDSAALERAAQRGREAAKYNNSPLGLNPYPYNEQRHRHIAWRDAFKAAVKERKDASC